MFKQLKKLLQSITQVNNQPANESNDEKPLSKSMAKNLKYIKEVMGNPTDLVDHPFEIANEDIKGSLIFFDTLVDQKLISSEILKDLLLQVPLLRDETAYADKLNFINKSSLTSARINEIYTLKDCLTNLLVGKSILLLENYDIALAISTTKLPARTVAEPESEAVVRGPREGFTEALNVNLGLLRKRLRTPAFRIENFVIGEQTQTIICLCYLDKIANQEVVAEVRNRLSKITTDAILESGYIEEFIEDNPYSPFPTLEHSERPDKVTAAILEGRVAIITEGTPFVLIGPTTFFQFLQSSEDYYERYLFGTFVRWLRIVAFHVAFLLPSLYIAATTIHQEMIPTQLALSTAAARSGVPFPAFLEAFVMELVFEILREAGVRLPKTVGQAVSIVGALVIGQAAVEANLISSPMVIVVSITAIASFSVPAYNMAISLRLLRFPMMMLAGALGFPGIVIGMMVLLMHLISLRSFGVPYWSPLAPLSFGDLKDTIVRVPIWAMFLRPRLVGFKNPQRQGVDLKPRPPKERDVNNDPEGSN